jgi:prepilin-type N-terminal cleavage/methylation domain-containing protein
MLPSKTLIKIKDGFTIVETLIVLAVAGLILLIILNAIPALDRSSRNNQTRQDIQLILAAVSRWELNNSGNFPSQPNNTTNPITSNTDFLYDVPLTYYNNVIDSTHPFPTNIILQTTNSIYAAGTTIASTPFMNTSTLNTVIIANHLKCDSNNDGNATYQGASYSDVVALYSIDTGNNASPQCSEL